RIISATVVIGPLITALFGSPRQTAAVAVAAIAACAVSGAWNDNFGTEDYVVRLLVVVSGAGFAIAGVRSRMQLAADRERFRLLSAAAAISDAPRSVAETVQALSGLLVPALADICVVDVVRDGVTERLAVAAHGPRAAEIERGLRERAEHAAARAGGSPGTAMATGRPQLIEDADARVVGAAAHDDGDLQFLRSLDGRSSVVVPLGARGRRIGSMALIVTGASGRRYDARDLEFAKVLGGRVALALDNAGLFSAVESLEAQQMAALGSLAEAVTIQNRRGELVYANDAAARSLGFDSAARLRATPPREIADTFESFLEDGSPLRLEELPGRRVLAGEEAEPLLVRAVNRATGEERWRVVKATAVHDADGRPYLAVNVIEDVTDAKRAEIAQRFLARAGELLASSLDYEETLRQVARLAVPHLADWCGVSIPDDAGYLRSVAVAHVDPEKVRFAEEYDRRYPTRLGDPGGAARVIREGASQLVNDIPDELLEQSIDDPEQLAALRALGMRAVMIVPIVAAGDVIGTISFVSAESRRTFTQADLDLAEELGRRAGTAVENARLYTERSHIARTLQAGLLPGELPAIPGFALASLYRPAGQENVVGGDFYDAFETPSGWMLLIGDVTGRGAEAAALTAQARHTLRTAGALLGDARSTVERLNAALVDDGDLSICSVAVVVLERSEGRATATVLCAGHPQPLLVSGGRARAVGVCGPLVGAWPESRWATDTVTLEPGDLLVLYTDGVTDACGHDERFGERRLAVALADVRDAGAAVAAIQAELAAFEHGPQADDTAVVALQRLP
ncbi:MAG TPA: SpoIIE family protein phosphatase, partial [Solirubrobacteraceae bacterium]|nr:SpoIIE family protein phosphatase [Solirubrobacteraceae bacterium]